MRLRPTLRRVFAKRRPSRFRFASRGPRRRGSRRRAGTFSPPCSRILRLARTTCRELELESLVERRRAPLAEQTPEALAYANDEIGRQPCRWCVPCRAQTRRDRRGERLRIDAGPRVVLRDALDPPDDG